MKLQYKIDMSYDKKETLKVASILLRILMQTLGKVKEEQNFEPTDLVYYPLNAFTIGKTKKLILMSSPKAQGILQYVDEKFMKELEKEGLKVLREEIK